MPEEINRVVTDRVSDVLLCPSEDAVANLRDEGFRDDQIHLVGNVMIDTLRANLDRARARQRAAERFGVGGAPYGVVTLHRPANVDDPAILAQLVTRPQHDRRGAAARVPRPPTHAARGSPTTTSARGSSSRRRSATSTSSG